ncbi:MAG: M1 family peptidase [Magnetospirillum sp. WYHS-4]
MKPLLLLAALALTTAFAHQEVEVRFDPAAGKVTVGGGQLPMQGPDGFFLPTWLAAEEPFTYRIVLEAPLPWKALVPGRLVEETEERGRYRAVYESETPQDAIPLLAGPWSVRERMHGGIRLRTWFDAETAPLADDYLDLAAGYLDLYRGWIGEHAFAGFSVAAVPQPVGLGFPGLTAIGGRVLRLPFIRQTSLGHEILHDWWGNGVYVDYERGNWSEGLTTFMADYTYALRRSPEEGRAMRRQWLRDYAALPADRDRPALAFRSKTHDASQVVGYHKVAFLFHMLRDDIGSAAFDAAIRRFWRDFRFKAANWDDLRQVFEAESGRDLKAFFGQWLARPGAPRLTLADAKAEGGKVAFTLRQDDPPYALSVPVVVDGRREAVRLDGREQHYELPGGSELAVDPDADLFRRLDAAELPPILRDITLNGVAAVLAGADPAPALAKALMDTPPRFGKPEAGRPALLIGTSAEIEGFLAEAGLPPPPPEVAGRGTARVWAGRGHLVVEANDAQALAALARPLPHYGRRGWLVFEGSKAIAMGEWPAGDGPLRVRFSGNPSPR